MNHQAAAPFERVPYDLLVPAIRDLEVTARTVGLHLEPRHRSRFAELLRALAEAVDDDNDVPGATEHGETQLPLFG